MGIVDDDAGANEGSSFVASTNKVDSPKLDKDSLDLQMAGKLDVRNQVDYTFVGTGEEAFNHPLGRLPSVVHIAGQSVAASVHVNIFKSTKQKLYATSSVAGAKVRFVLG
jgi:hypothetical protein